jgi:hypothetical protein
MYKGRRVPEGRMMRGEREIALTTPVSLTAFQPSSYSWSEVIHQSGAKALKRLWSVSDARL